MIKTIKIEHDSSPFSHLQDVESILKSFGANYNLQEYDGGVKITYDPEYKNVEQEYEKALKDIEYLSKRIIQYAKALYVKQPHLPEGYNNGRIIGSKTKWTFEECINEAIHISYKEKLGFVEPRIVDVYGVDVQEVWNEKNNYNRNHNTDDK